ncbi:MAG: YchJ family protein [Porticoccaceae bacterium]|nr:YchJ family protein [Porticoccaceae bacterium]
MQTCPCGSTLSYSVCCQPLHLGAAAASAEALMRSRYSAFSMGLVDYLISSHHPGQRTPNERQSLQQSMENTHWLKLQIIHSQCGDSKGVVEFIATCEEDGQLGQLRERSNFVRENGHWYYLDGELLPVAKISRNDPCPCGSGKKFKKCHS